MDKPSKPNTGIGITYTPLVIQTGAGPDNFDLTFDYNELCEVETRIGLNLNQAVMRVDLCSAGQLRGIFWALLRTAHPKLTLKQCGELLSADFQAVCKAISAEILSAMHEDEGDQGQDQGQDQGDGQGKDVINPKAAEENAASAVSTAPAAMAVGTGTGTGTGT